MERHFETSLNELSAQLAVMAGHVERAIGNVIEGLKAKNLELIQSVYEIEKTINQESMALDEVCVTLIALHQPMAADLRLLIAIIKMNTDLERMGDLAVNIAHDSQDYLQGQPLKSLQNLPIMCAEVQAMVRGSINAFLSRDVDMAKVVLGQDDFVDELKNKIIADVAELIKVRPVEFEQGLHLILIARHLERIGDHATNIAEDVIYIASGKDIRHGGRHGDRYGDRHGGQKSR